MKKYMRLVSGIVSVGILGGLAAVPAFAADTERIISEKIDSVISVEENGYEEIKTINKNDLVKAGLLDTAGSTRLDTQIIEALDICEEGSALYDDLHDMLAQGTELTVSSKYLKIDEATGAQQVIPKDQCIREANAVNLKKEAELANRIYSEGSNVRLASARSLDYDGDEKKSTDGYMLLTIAYLGVPEDGNYVFSGGAKWLTMPPKRGKDAISLYCSEVAWTDEFQATIEYDDRLINAYNGSSTTKKVVDTLEGDEANIVYDEGFYYEFVLPDDLYEEAYTVQILNYSITISGHAFVKYPDELRYFNLYTNYAHTLSSLFNWVTFSWNIGGIFGVSVNTNKFTSAKNYDHMILINR